MDPWLQSLRSFLNTTLARIIDSANERNKYLTPEAMVIWTRAFTHETVSPSDNYEDLEFLGDAILKAVFPKYLMKRFPYLHKGEYTELNVAYMSKMTQAELSRKLGLNNYIRVKGLDRSILNLDTDVFEAFFGALDEVSDLIFKGLGILNCYKMIIDIFKDFEIDESRGKGSAKTQVIQIFVRFDLPEPEQRTPGTNVQIVASEQLAKAVGSRDRIIGNATAASEKEARNGALFQSMSVLRDAGLLEIFEENITKKREDENVTFAVKLRPQHLKFLESYGVKIANPIIGYGEAPTKKEAEIIAYDNALKFLESLGIDTEWAEEAKLALDFSGEDIERFIPAATRRYQAEGFESIYFFIPRKTVTKRGAVIQLVGIRPDDKHEVLKVVHATDNENSYRAAKVRLVREYSYGQ